MAFTASFRAVWLYFFIVSSPASFPGGEAVPVPEPIPDDDTVEVRRAMASMFSHIVIALMNIGSSAGTSRTPVIACTWERSFINSCSIRSAASRERPCGMTGFGHKLATSSSRTG
ncbi:hypothetical protein CTJ15_03045 (plasmid) [Roseomonas sp. FDAARGOS_362]|uniref:hypothetical protein n=1 Tax=Roseomonas sp. FDAARGOS_362 TaxID=2018065 RepID=UPI000C19466D|nr:hypothetical protein [Roseomonas sp. FDAARGOS_362]ATR19361.1 hypothetical protein CTJ15_03045 [Roseomonas sp. FDAARGOS_362]